MTSMKPEYNYGDEKTYSVYVYDSLFTIKFVGKIFIWLLSRIWFDPLNTVHIFEGLNEEQIASIQPELEKVRSYRVCENHFYTLFRNDILMADVPNRQKPFYPNLTTEQQHQRSIESAQWINREYSWELAKLNEYSFELWAENEQIDEAYRLMIIPSFHNTCVIRVWVKDDVARLVYKIRGGQVNCQHRLKRHIEKILRHKKWQEVQRFMEQKFWTAETWSPPNWIEGVDGERILLENLDGEMYLFEGWHSGQYKLLDDHSPNDEQVSAQAAKLLLSLAHKKSLDFSSLNRRIEV